MRYRKAVIKDMPLFMRPREKLVEKGVTALSDTELLALLLRSGSSTKNVFEVAQEIITKHPLPSLQLIKSQEIMKINGVGITGASGIIAGIELGKRVLHHDLSPVIQTPEDVIKTVSFIREKKREYFVGIYLNARRQLLTTSVISIGTLDMSIAHPREVFEPAIKHHASAVIVAHNHPSGDPQPSHADILITRRLADAGNILDIELQDHIIIAAHSYVSFTQEDLL